MSAHNSFTAKQERKAKKKAIEKRYREMTDLLAERIRPRPRWAPKRFWKWVIKQVLVLPESKVIEKTD